MPEELQSIDTSGRAKRDVNRAQILNSPEEPECASKGQSTTHKGSSNESEEDGITPDYTFASSTSRPSSPVSPASSVDATYTPSGESWVRCRSESVTEQSGRDGVLGMPKLGSRPLASIASTLSRFLPPTRRSTEPGYTSWPPEAATNRSVKTRLGSVTVPIPSKDKICAFRGAPGLYVGFEDQIRPPPDLVIRWVVISQRFWTDALEFQNKITKTAAGHRRPPGMSFELKMSGYTPSPLSAQVELLPRIWVLYDDERWAKQIKKFVDESEWLRNEGFGEIEVRKGSPRLATLRSPMFVEGLEIEPLKGFPIGGDSQLLHLHAERRGGTSTMGLLCCATVTKNGTICGQRVSRLGGQVTFNNGTTSLGIMTAHGILDLSWDIISDDAADLDEYSGLSGCPADAVVCESTESLDFDNPAWSEALPGRMAVLEVDEVRKWDPVEILGVTSFLGDSSLDLSSTASTRQDWAPERPPVHNMTRREDSDFCLWYIPEFSALRNIYQCAVSNTPTPIRQTDGLSFEESSLFGSEAVIVILAPEHLVQAHVVPGVAHFTVYGKQFTSRKIRTEVTPGTYSKSGLLVQPSLTLVSPPTQANLLHPTRPRLLRFVGRQGPKACRHDHRSIRARAVRPHYNMQRFVCRY